MTNQHPQHVRTMIEALIDDAMADATVDYPAGRDAGPRINWDIEALIDSILAAIQPDQPVAGEPVGFGSTDLRWRKKPVVIEAFQMTRERRIDNAEWPLWLHAAWNGGRGVEGTLQRVDMTASLPDDLEIVTLEGNHRVSWDDWIIRGVYGELYPCKPDIFAKTYESATPSSAPASVAIARFIAAYDKANPMRTADLHADGCDCLRCAVDLLRALSEGE